MQPTAITQLAKKLLVKTVQCWLFLNSPDGFLESFTLPNIKIETIITAEETFNGVLLFVKNSNELQSALPQFNSVLKSKIVCWVAYPKKSSGMVSDLEMTGNWTELENYNLRIV